ncbi:MAG: hypothetical protein AB9835_08425 [Eubacteriales bacterium]
MKSFDLADTIAVRKAIIQALVTRFSQDCAVRALWLEGSDGVGKSDEYSDLDFWLDVEDGMENAVLDECVKTIAAIGKLDYSSRFDHPHPKIFQHCLHVAGTSEYLLVDICVQSHSRGREGCTFTRGDIAEFPLVLFDKDEVVAIVEPRDTDASVIIKELDRCADVFSQRSRVVKYIRRGKFLEALAYYGKYVLYPLVDALRLLYTPTHREYGPVHISEHLPEHEVRELEALHKISSLDDIERSLSRADKLFARVRQALEEKYPRD